MARTYAHAHRTTQWSTSNRHGVQIKNLIRLHLLMRVWLIVVFHPSK